MQSGTPGIAPPANPPLGVSARDTWLGAKLQTGTCEYCGAALAGVKVLLALNLPLFDFAEAYWRRPHEYRQRHFRMSLGDASWPVTLPIAPPDVGMTEHRFGPYADNPAGWAAFDRLCKQARFQPTWHNVIARDAIRIGGVLALRHRSEFSVIPLDRASLKIRRDETANWT